jgi:superoxide reductase
MKLADVIKQADWKTEKHIPAIEAPAQVKAGELFDVTVTLGKEIAHPNTTEHHIRWIEVYFMPDGGKFPFHVGRFEFTAHGESTDGPNMGPVYTHHKVTFGMKVTKPGTIIAMSLCNIHGLWDNSAAVAVA